MKRHTIKMGPRFKTSRMDPDPDPECDEILPEYVRCSNGALAAFTKSLTTKLSAKAALQVATVKSTSHTYNS